MAPVLCFCSEKDLCYYRVADVRLQIRIRIIYACSCAHHSSAIRIILSRWISLQKWCWIPIHFGRCRPPLGGLIEPLWHHRLPTVWERGLGTNEADFSEQRGLLTTPGKRRCSRWRLRLPKSCSSRELFSGE